MKTIAGQSGYPFGYTETEFITAVEKPDWEDTDMHGVPQTSAAWKRGRVKAIRQYNKNENLIAEKTYTYTEQAENTRRFVDDAGSSKRKIDSIG